MCSFKRNILVLPAILIIACSNNGQNQNNIVAKGDSINGVDTMKHSNVVSREVRIKNDKFDKMANYISGIKNSGEEYSTLQNYDCWKDYTVFIDKSWKEVQDVRLNKMRVWMQTENSDVYKSNETLFYPFSGPDFLNAFTLFPNAKTYYLLALEPRGTLPDIHKMKESAAKSYFNNMRENLDDIFGKSYFITKKMNKELKYGLVDGTLPLITVFIKRTGNTIINITRVDIDSLGNAHETPYDSTEKSMRRPKGMRINFYAGNDSNDIRTAYYFSCDLSDEVFNPAGKFYKYLATFGTTTTYLKAASYLLHYTNFKNMRKYIVQHSKYILQDDTGVPLNALNTKEWDIQLYGVYVKPVEDFKGVWQPDLKKLYDNDKTVKSLPFELGYHWGSKKDNLMRFTKK